MDGGNGKGAAVETAAVGAKAGVSPAMKEVVFSIIRKLENEGVAEGERQLWTWFSGMPNVVAMKKEDGYVVVLWREGVVVKVFLDHSFNVTGFSVEGP